MNPYKIKIYLDLYSMIVSADPVQRLLKIRAQD